MHRSIFVPMQDTGLPALSVIMDHEYTPHVRSRGEEKREKEEGKKARRWVVEVTFSWFNRFRKLLIRWEKTHSNYLALLHFACAIIVWRKIRRLVEITFLYLKR